MNKRHAAAQFRDRLAQLQAQSGLTQSAFAQAIGIDRSALSQLMSGANPRLPRAETLLALATQLHAALRGRCLPPETLDVDVPEGMREIRFEYRRPGKPGDRPGLRPMMRADS